MGGTSTLSFSVRRIFEVTRDNRITSYFAVFCVQLDFSESDAVAIYWDAEAADPKRILS